MMIIKRSDVIGCEIVDRVSGHRLGFASDLLIENLTRRMTGLLYVAPGERWFLPRNRVAVFGRDSILVDAPKMQTPEPEVSYVSWNEHQIVTRSGQKLGRLDDFYFDSLTGYVGGFVFTDVNRRLFYSEYFESWSPGTITVRDAAQNRIENENERSVGRLIENIKARAIVNAREFADLLGSLSSKLAADVSGTLKNAGEAVKPALRRAWAEASETAAKLDRWIEEKTASARHKARGWTENLKQFARAAWRKLTGGSQDGFGNRPLSQS